MIFTSISIYHIADNKCACVCAIVFIVYVCIYKFKNIWFLFGLQTSKTIMFENFNIKKLKLLNRLIKLVITFKFLININY